MATETKTGEEYVYHQGGIPGRRPVLRGSKAYQTFEEITLVDVTDITSPSFEGRTAVADKVAKPCAEVGFFYARSHDVPQDVIDEIFAAIKEFFDQPNEEKMTVHIHKKNRGDMKASFLMGPDKTDAAQELPFLAHTGESVNKWPPNNERFRVAVTKYYNHLQRFLKELTRTFALALGMDEHFFDRMCTFAAGYMRPLMMERLMKRAVKWVVRMMKVVKVVIIRININI
ncbi:Isopenicillin N synthase [Talaromyces pinophilus]|nr:Isopenicillin N synthase [Talaromyces pinophilus]